MVRTMLRFNPSHRRRSRRWRTRAGALLGAVLGLAAGATSASADPAVAFEELRGDQCFMFSQLVPYRIEGNQPIEQPLQIVINDESGYRKLFDPKLERASCAGADLTKVIPKVDFAKRTVLGLWGSGSCAATGFKKEVSIDRQKQVLTYSVAPIESEISCSGPGLDSLNLITVPKIPPGYKVVFENRRD